MGLLRREVPAGVAQNLNPRYELRPRQADAFARFIHCRQNDFPNKARPLHFLFNMAAGSAKTLIMAGAIDPRTVLVALFTRRSSGQITEAQRDRAWVFMGYVPGGWKDCQRALIAEEQGTRNNDDSRSWSELKRQGRQVSGGRFVEEKRRCFIQKPYIPPRSAETTAQYLAKKGFIRYLT